MRTTTLWYTISRQLLSATKEEKLKNILNLRLFSHPSPYSYVKKNVKLVIWDLSGFEVAVGFKVSFVIILNQSKVLAICNPMAIIPAI